METEKMVMVFDILSVLVKPFFLLGALGVTILLIIYCYNVWKMKSRKNGIYTLISLLLLSIQTVAMGMLTISLTYLEAKGVTEESSPSAIVFLFYWGSFIPVWLVPIIFIFSIYLLTTRIPTNVMVGIICLICNIQALGAMRIIVVAA